MADKLVWEYDKDPGSNWLHARFRFIYPYVIYPRFLGLLGNRGFILKEVAKNKKFKCKTVVEAKRLAEYRWYGNR